MGGFEARVSQLSTEAPHGQEEKRQEGGKEEEKEEGSRKKGKKEIVEETRTQGGQEEGQAEKGEKGGQTGAGDRGIAERGVVDDAVAGRGENRSESRGSVALSDGLQALKAGRESSCAQSGAARLGLSCRSLAGFCWRLKTCEQALTYVAWVSHGSPFRP